MVPCDTWGQMTGTMTRLMTGLHNCSFSASRLLTGAAAGLPPPDWTCTCSTCTCARQMAPPCTKYRPHTWQIENTQVPTRPEIKSAAHVRLQLRWRQAERRKVVPSGVLPSAPELPSRAGTGWLESHRQLRGHDRRPRTRALGYAENIGAAEV